MAEIGTFTRTETGYAGELHSFGLHEKLFIVPAKPSDVKNAPDYRLRLDSEDGPDVGPAWKDASEQSGDDPSVWTLRWKHPRKVEDEE